MKTHTEPIAPNRGPADVHLEVTAVEGLHVAADLDARTARELRDALDETLHRLAHEHQAPDVVESDLKVEALEGEKTARYGPGPAGTGSERPELDELQEGVIAVWKSGGCIMRGEVVDVELSDPHGAFVVTMDDGHRVLKPEIIATEVPLADNVLEDDRRDASSGSSGSNPMPDGGRPIPERCATCGGDVELVRTDDQGVGEVQHLRCQGPCRGGGHVSVDVDGAPIARDGPVIRTQRRGRRALADGGEEIVYVSPGWTSPPGPRVVHATPECPALTRADSNIFEKRLEVLGTDTRRCQRCHGEDAYGGGSNGHLESLEATDPDDVDDAPLVSDGGDDVAPDTEVIITQSRGNDRVFHLEEDCMALGGARRTHTKRRGLLADDIDLCRACAGDVEITNAGRTGHIELLLETDPDDVGGELVTDGGAVAADDGDDPVDLDELISVTVRIPRGQIGELEDLVDEGRFSSRSEAIRAGIRRVTGLFDR